MDPVSLVVQLLGLVITGATGYYAAKIGANIQAKATREATDKQLAFQKELAKEEWHLNQREGHVRVVFDYIGAMFEAYGSAVGAMLRGDGPLLKQMVDSFGEHRRHNSLFPWLLIKDEVLRDEIADYWQKDYEVRTKLVHIANGSYSGADLQRFAEHILFLRTWHLTERAKQIRESADIYVSGGKATRHEPVLDSPLNPVPPELAGLVPAPLTPPA